MLKRIGISSALMFCLGLSAYASDASGWRGNGTGRFPDITGIQKLDQEENIIWETPTPNWSNASPIISGSKLFICAERDSLICLDKATGAILWQRSNSYVDLAPDAQKDDVRQKMEDAERLQKELRKIQHKVRQLRKKAKENPEDEQVKAEIEELKPEEKRLRDALAPLSAYALPSTHGANGYSAPTPVTDGTAVYALFGTGVAVAYDLDGNRLWGRVLEKPTAGWGHSSSPVLAAGRLILNVRNVHGLDPVTGETVWTAKSKPRWGTSVATEIDSTPVVITPNGEIIRAEDGEILAAGLHGLTYCAPLVHDNVVYFIEHGGKAFRLPATADGSEKPELLWKTEPPKERYYASPLYHEGHIYCINQKGVYSIIDAETGKVVKSEKISSLRGTVYSSVTLVGELVFLGAEQGSTAFLEPGLEIREVSTGKLDKYRTTPVFEDGRAYIRALKTMYCIGN